VESLGGVGFTLRKRLRRWLGIAAIQRQVRDLENAHKALKSDLEAGMAVTTADLERLNAATSRIAARVASLLDQIDQLGTGNDDEVRAQAMQEALLQSSSELRPVIEQLEALGADATNVVPEPSTDQVPVAPGGDVAPVENLADVGGTDAAGTDLDSDVPAVDNRVEPVEGIGDVDTETPVTPPETQEAQRQAYEQRRRR
jgi:hypothetical protein